MDRDTARDYINAQEPTFLQKAKLAGYICPACNQGANKGHGITRATGRPNLWHCVDCQKERSILGLYAIQAGIPDTPDRYPEILEAAAGYYGVILDGKPSTRSSAQEDFREDQNQPKTEQGPGFSSLYREAAAHLSETDYPQRRGLSPETCRRFNIGFLPAWTHPKRTYRGDKPSPRLIIPISRENYLARYTGPGSYINADGNEMNKGKAMLKNGLSWTFNAEALRTADKPIFVVEGELDALSIAEIGGEAVSIGSTENVNNFVNITLDKVKPRQPLVISLDNDEAGKKTEPNLEKQLQEKGVKCYRYNIAGDYKDANERLQADRAGLAAAVAKAEEPDFLEQIAAQERRDAYMQNSAAAHLQAFINGITESVNTPVIPTGFPKLDEALDGGLFEGLYICGAISSLGKTTFITQIADQIAQGGRDVLIFSLEMARAELMAKSISRHTLQEVLDAGGETRLAKTTRGITTGARYAKYSREERELIRNAIQNYNEYARHIFITEGIGDIGAQQIRETVQEHVTVTGAAPVVVIDYLQILAPYSERSSDKQNTDKAVLELKRISRDFKTPVIAISSFNRENYSAAVKMEAFKESGAVEYSSDVLIGLQLAGAGEKNFDATAAKQKSPRDVELVILKNRNGRTGDKIAFQYYPLFNFFKEQ